MKNLVPETKGLKQPLVETYKKLQRPLERTPDVVESLIPTLADIIANAGKPVTDKELLKWGRDIHTKAGSLLEEYIKGAKQAPLRNLLNILKKINPDSLLGGSPLSAKTKKALVWLSNMGDKLLKIIQKKKRF